ncbi:hypothetical protein WR25_09052 [Diploscapter pachys]|uniref:Uncharacterized protein n=1 Tax=Diploscapter pachys TaxID=2018661 RepID=A0A2A2K6C7_9BILA|nr:hypothetical protein WR25_09052 [Diploscapter pachys]
MTDSAVYNDTFNREVISFYIQAVNRVHNSGMDEVAALIVADHTYQKLIIAFRSSDSISQFFAQGFTMVLGMMEDFKLGGKMLSYYNRAYNDMIEQEFETILRDSIQKYPTYQPIVKHAFRIIRDGDWVPDTPFRISQNLPNPHHTPYEVFYGSHMSASNYHICPQAETEECNKGSWWRFPAISHIFMFDQNYINYLLRNCTKD